MFGSQTNYQKSNSITRVAFSVSSEAKRLVKKLLSTTSAEARQFDGEALLDELSDSAGIDVVTLRISATRQYHKKRNGKTVFKQYGYYRPQSHYIYIQNQTAVRGQDLAPKTFLDTLLHEWLHHYDHKKLKLDSIHTSGFYLRLKSLKDLLEIK